MIKQLQSMQGIKSSHAEMEEARRMIIAQLFEVFQNTSHQDNDLQWDLLSKVSKGEQRMCSS